MRKRRNINVAEQTLRMIERLARGHDYESDINVSDMIEIHRLAKQGLEALTVERKAV